MAGVGVNCGNSKIPLPPEPGDVATCAPVGYVLSSGDEREQEMPMTRCFFTTALAAALMMAVPAARAETIVTHFDLPEGRLENTHVIEYGGFSTVLKWLPKKGPPEVVYAAKGPPIRDRHWTLEGAFISGDVLALCRGCSYGSIEHWQMKKQDGEWTFVSRAFLGAGSRAVGVHLPDTRTVEIRLPSQVVERFEITDRSFGGDPVFRVVIKNGKEIRFQSQGGTE